MTRWLILTSRHIAIRYIVCDYTVEFRVYDAWTDTGDKWGVIDCDEGPLEFHEITDETDWELDGAIKWDGCINWQTNPDCMAHGCGPSYADQLRLIFTTLYTIAKRHFDLLDDPVEPLDDSVLEIEV